MDRLRALQYFAAAAAERSLSGAAREFAVSVPAVAKMINALEKSLGVRLFERSARGLSLTADGARYLEACVPALTQLHDADEWLRATTSRPKGTVVIGVQHVVARGYLTAILPRFHALYPDIDIDVRDFQRVTDEDLGGVDLVLVLGWPKTERACAATDCRRPLYRRRVAGLLGGAWHAQAPQRPRASRLPAYPCFRRNGNGSVEVS